ncbi:cysteine--tRNA ligase [Alphaproteobacteria bacterium]|nr:cysteine--tRNA ligase [Alphaproteobacteria bacterium]
MTLHLFNSLTKKKESFVPIDSNHVKFYVCGPTVYDRAHIGNARPVVVFDILFRLLKHLYPKVSYARNITDIDDKIIKAAAEKKAPISMITEKFTQFYIQDMEALNALPPTIMPRATDHIEEMKAIIQNLIDKGFSYENEGHVLFDVPKDKGYGKLSRFNLDDQISGARVEVAPYKKNPQDFILWKPSTSDQPGWDSPWGRGRPGWHIECSAMGKKHLGKTFDIHGGGIDLIFPHHENEIAQSECSHEGAPLANIWMHNGHLIVNGEKMSKSLGNFFTVNDLLKNTQGEVIRLTLLSAHYRQPLDWQEATVLQNKNILDRFYTALQGLESHPEKGDIPEATLKALKDDLNIPEALSSLHTIVSQIHKASTSEEKIQLQKQLKAGGQLMGFFAQTSEEWFKKGTTEGVNDSEIQSLINQRVQARLEKDFFKADEIRHLLEKQGILLEDTSNGTTWKRK